MIYNKGDGNDALEVKEEEKKTDTTIFFLVEHYNHLKPGLKSIKIFIKYKHYLNIYIVHY